MCRAIPGPRDRHECHLIAWAPAEMWEKVPQAVNLNTWPATIFIVRDGRVKLIHSGFTVPASGVLNAQLKDEFTTTIECLLAESGEGPQVFRYRQIIDKVLEREPPAKLNLRLWRHVFLRRSQGAGESRCTALLMQSPKSGSPRNALQSAANSLYFSAMIWLTTKRDALSVLAFFALTPRGDLCLCCRSIGIGPAEM